MRPSSDCEALVRRFEGEKLRVYPDPATGGAPWTAGVGHTGHDVVPGMTVTREMSEAWLKADLARFGAGVEQLLRGARTTQAQFDAMVSFAFNVGLGNFGSSTLLRMHRAGDHTGAAAQFARWNKAAGKVLPGLVKRRSAEAALYRKAVSQ